MLDTNKGYHNYNCHWQKAYKFIYAYVTCDVLTICQQQAKYRFLDATSSLFIYTIFASNSGSVSKPHHNCMA